MICCHIFGTPVDSQRNQLIILVFHLSFQLYMCMIIRLFPFLAGILRCFFSQKRLPFCFFFQQKTIHFASQRILNLIRVIQGYTSIRCDVLMVLSRLNLRRFLSFHLKVPSTSVPPYGGAPGLKRLRSHISSDHIEVVGVLENVSHTIALT